ncbi:hypothetical protein JCM8547_004158 [Rhodosporidiobolus lusitaniae]
MFGSTGSSFGGFGQQNQQQQQQPQQTGGLFGATNTGGFGSTFGQSSTPAFGTAAQPAQNTGFGGFGATTSSAPTFGATPSTTPAFGQQANAGTGGGLFGSSQPSQASTGFSFGGGGTSTFGQSNTSSTGTTGGLFGAKPATTTFGGFGQPAQQPAQNGGLFGGGASTTPAFGAAAQPANNQPNGTATAPYATTTVMEPPAEEGKPAPTNQTAHQFQSITCMPQYNHWSFEELRLQDYAAGRKGPSATPAFGSAFGASSTPAFGASNTGSTGGGLFGSTPSTGAFGQPASSTPAFGQSNTTGGGLFGSNTGATSTFGQPAQPATGGGLFGSAATSQPAQTGGLFGSTTATSTPFGQPAAPAATPAFGGFGAAAAPKPATTGFSFGGASTTPAAGTAGGGLFGQPAQPAAGATNPFGQPAQPAAGGGLFGQPAQPAAGAAPSFSFGQPAAQKPSLFGNTPATSAPAFGAAAPAAAGAAKPAFSFGSTAPAAGTTGSGLFGSTAPAAAGTTSLFGQPAQQQQPAAGGGLFGQSATPAAGTSTFGSGGLFGAKPAAPAAGGGLFGSTAPAAGGGLFGSSAAAQPAGQTSLFGSTTGAPALGGSLFGSIAAQPAQQQQQQQATAYASADDANAYGSNPLFASVAGGISPARPVEEKKKPPIFTAFRGTPVSRSNTKITRLRGFGNSSTSSPAPLSAGLGGSLSASSAFNSSVSGSTPGTPGGGRGSPLRLMNGIGDDVALSPNAFVSRPSVKKLVIDKKSAAKTFGASPAKDGAAAVNGGAKAKVSFNPEVEVPSRSASLFGSRTPAPAGAGDDENSFAVSEGDATNGNVTLDSPSLGKTASSTEWPSRRPNTSSTSSPATAASKPKQHGDYFTIPSLDTLQKLPAAKLRAVPDLVVGRIGYGQVAFSQPVDLTTLSSVEDLLGSLVRLEDRNATVYPEEFEDVKPPPGEGLNVPATITLENCFPLDKATRKPIRDGEHPRVQQHVKRLRGLEGTSFVDFDAESGTWTFEVTEF